MKRIALLFLMVCSVAYGQWRDSSRFTIPTPAGKQVRFTNVSIGDTNTSKTSGTLAYMNSGFFISNGTYFQQMGTTVSNDTATYVTKNSTQVVTSPKYWTTRQYMTSLAVDTIVNRSGGLVYSDRYSFYGSGPQIQLGTPSSINGSIRFYHATDGNFTTLSSNTTTGSVTLALPDVGGTLATLAGGQTFTSATWNATAIDTAYSNSLAHISAGYGITATRYNTKDFQIKADTSLIATTGTAQLITGAKYHSASIQNTLATGQTGLRLVTTGIDGPAVAWRAGFLGASSTLGAVMRADSTSTWSVKTIGGSTILSANTTGLTVGGAVSNIASTTTVGAWGVPIVVDTMTRAGVNSSVSAKSLSAVVGLYRLTYSIFCTTAGTGGTAQMTLSFNNGAAQTMTSAAIALTSTTSKDDNVFTYYVASGTPTVSVTVAGATGSPVYSIHAIVERVK